MKIKFYGTAAAEGIPAPFCKCEVCQNARKVGGKEIRTRHLSTIDEDIQIDIGPDFLHHTMFSGLNAMGIKYMLLTHSHMDHMDAISIDIRQYPYSLTGVQHTDMIAGKKTFDVMVEKVGDIFDKMNASPIIAVPYEKIILDENTFVTPMPARHQEEGSDAMIYLIEREGKQLLYAHDTGILFDEVVDFLSGRKIDAISLDCTGTYLGAGTKHMDFAGCEAVVKLLKANGAIKENAVIIINHFSHGGGATYEQIKKEADKRGWVATYDTFEIEI